MRSWPTGPLRQNDRFVAAFCDDLFDRCVTGSDPKSRDRIAEINHQINSTPREADVSNKPSAAIR